MSRGLRRQAPALLVACIALVAALGGTVYAGGKKGKKIDGKLVKVNSMPGNRLKAGSVPGNRLKPKSISSDRLKPGAISGANLEPGSVTGLQIDVATLGQVPSAIHADNADSAGSARDAETALYAVNAIDAEKVNGHTAGCAEGTRYFAGACWQKEASKEVVPAPTAARACANEGGELPSALALVAFSDVATLDLGDEWSGDLTNVSGLDSYAVVTVSRKGKVNFVFFSENRSYRCVIPLLK